MCPAQDDCNSMFLKDSMFSANQPVLVNNSVKYDISITRVFIQVNEVHYDYHGDVIKIVFH